MKAQKYIKNGFWYITFVGSKDELNDFLQPYDDGQGRSYDILDEEIYE